jgi:ribonuclease HI
MKQDIDSDIVIFTDGSSLGNPGPGGWGAVIVFRLKDKVAEIGGYEKMTTNNRMEITAAIEALLTLEDKEGDLTVYSDSSYLLNGITSWIRGWEANGWQTKTKEEVLNRDLWERLALLSRAREEKGKIHWKKVKGHSDVLGNQRADAIATSFAEQKDAAFAHGSLSEYEKALGGSLLHIPEYKSSGKSSKKTGPGYSYLSLIDGNIEKYKTWAECEKAVRGMRGVKYKKALSAEDEEKIIKEWRSAM